MSEIEKKDWSYFNDRRRALAAGDPDYAEKHRAASREGMRKSHGLSPKLFDCRENIAKLSEWTEQVNIAGQAMEVISVAGLAQALGGKRPSSVRKWITDGRLPAPVNTAELATNAFGRIGETQEVEVYTRAEAEIILDVLGEHLSKISYYLNKHTAVRDTLYSRLKEETNG